MNPATIYTFLVAAVVAMVFVTTWCLDRLVEARERERLATAEIERLRAKLLQPYDWRS